MSEVVSHHFLLLFLSRSFEAYDDTNYLLQNGWPSVN